MPGQKELSLSNPAFVWTPQPVNIWVAIEPYNTLQAYALRQLRARLESRGCIFVERPDQETPLGPIAHLGREDALEPEHA